MENKSGKFLGAIALIVAVIALLVSVGAKVSDSGKLGVDGDTNLINLVLEGDLTVADDATVTDDLTVSGGSLSVTTAANATSTLVAGCIQTYATSSATPLKLDFYGGNASSTVNGQAGAPVAWRFGTCP